MTATAVPVVQSEDLKFIRECCHCRRTWTGKDWGRRPSAPEARVTHGICRDCYVIHYPGFPLPPNIR